MAITSYWFESIQNCMKFKLSNNSTLHKVYEDLVMLSCKYYKQKCYMKVTLHDLQLCYYSFENV